MNTFEPRIGTLPVTQREMLPLLRPLAPLGFVLYGGTAIALRLGHRESVDFDFFSSAPLNKDALRSNLGFLGKARLIQDSKDTLSVITVTDVKLSFFGELSFGRFGETQMANPFGIAVASLDDLLALKLKVVHQRAELKDYRDIAAILAYGLPLERGMAIACAMFEGSLSPAITAKALTYFEDGDLAELSAEERAILIGAATCMGDLPAAPMRSPHLAVPPKD